MQNTSTSSSNSAPPPPAAAVPPAPLPRQPLAPAQTRQPRKNQKSRYPPPLPPRSHVTSFASSTSTPTTSPKPPIRSPIPIKILNNNNHHNRKKLPPVPTQSVLKTLDTRSQITPPPIDHHSIPTPPARDAVEAQKKLATTRQRSSRKQKTLSTTTIDPELLKILARQELETIDYHHTERSSSSISRNNQHSNTVLKKQPTSSNKSINQSTTCQQDSTDDIILCGNCRQTFPSDTHRLQSSSDEILPTYEETITIFEESKSNPSKINKNSRTDRGCYRQCVEAVTCLHDRLTYQCCYEERNNAHNYRNGGASSTVDKACSCEVQNTTRGCLYSMLTSVLPCLCLYPVIKGCEYFGKSSTKKRKSSCCNQSCRCKTRNEHCDKTPQ